MSFPVVHPLFSIPLYESRIHFDKQYIIEYLEKDLQWVTETFINNNRNDISVDQRILDTEFFKTSDNSTPNLSGYIKVGINL